MNEGKDIIIVADYHAENIEFRWFNEATGEERTGKYPTTRAGILSQVEQAAVELAPGGRIVWLMESTTGWAVSKPPHSKKDQAGPLMPNAQCPVPRPPARRLAAFTRQ